MAATPSVVSSGPVVIAAHSEDVRNHSAPAVHTLQSQEKEKDAEKEDGALQQGTDEPPYSVWSRWEKIALVLFGSAASTLSTMSGQIYFPVIQTIADAFHVSIQAINLTVTSYLILQGLSPMIFGPIADAKGRRLALIICLTILTGSCIGMAVMPEDAYWLLVLLRAVQSTGSASTISIGYGLITDIATPSERGMLIGLAGIAPMLGPSLGPIVAGVLADKFGWRGIFWFLAALSAAVDVAIILFMPETLRAIVGDGSIRPPWYLRPVLPAMTKYNRWSTEVGDAENIVVARGSTKYQWPTFLKEPDVVAALTSTAIIFALFQAVSASLSPMLLDAYPYLNQSTIGLCFLPVGVAGIIGAVVQGKVIDSEFRRAGGTKGGVLPPEFPIEYTRLRLVPIYLTGAVCTAIIFGWTTGHTSLAAPLAFLFFYGWSTIAFMNVYQTLILDLLPGQGASVTAASNLFRCLLGAGVVAGVDALRRRLGSGWTFVLLGGLTVVLVLPILAFSRMCGPRFREKRRLRKERLAARQL
ncbi:MFS general substrate transporter [Auriculariales sp. MPI-PUGE-AT-0066]|nr:MFS general substrate transporter [Auriculariales sp. MPI-PUGE-AT-0066]